MVGSSKMSFGTWRSKRNYNRQIILQISTIQRNTITRWLTGSTGKEKICASTHEEEYRLSFSQVSDQCVLTFDVSYGNLHMFFIFFSLPLASLFVALLYKLTQTCCIPASVYWVLYTTTPSFTMTAFKCASE